MTDQDFDFSIETKDSCVVSTQVVEENERIIVEVTAEYEKPCIPQPIVLTWRDKMLDIAATWYPICDRSHSVKQWIWPTKVPANLYYGSPLFATVRNDGTNNTVVALSDTVKPSQISFCVEDFQEKDEVRYEVTLLAKEVDECEKYQVKLYIDRRNIEFYRAVQDAASWMRSVNGIEKYVPAIAELPLYSTWYNFHQNPREDLLGAELKKAKDVGFETVIIDDGWQFAGRGSGDYSECGDWSVCEEKFKNFAEFIGNIHKIGMKAMLWFPVPFVGYKTKDYQAYKDKLLYNDEVSQAGIYDVRYACVRTHIIDTYVKFVDAYQLDGLKLDFVDSFKLLPESPAYNDEMDCTTVEKAVSTLLTEINATLKAKNKDFMIEFRQNYVGTEIVSHCNMLRIMDCAYDSITNRLGVIDMRLAHTDTAIHADMLLWSKEESVQNCAKQLLNVMFGVPQISVLLTKIPQKQTELIQKFLAYWNKNREVLLHGEFKAFGVASNYTDVSSEDKKKKITVLYAKNLYEYTGKTEDVFNNTDSDTICVANTEESALRIQIYDYNFKEVNVIIVRDKANVVNVPVGGYCTVNRI